MFKYLISLFKGKSAAERMREQTMKEQKIIIANKKPFYHEMIGASDGSRLVRVYNRKSGEIVEEKKCANKEEAIETSLVLLAKYNKGE